MHPAGLERERGRPAVPRGAVSRFVCRAGPDRPGVRLARGDVGDAVPRAAPPPGMAGQRRGPRGVRLGGGAELRPPGGRSVRSGVLPVGVGAGAATVRDADACDLAVLDAAAPDALARIRGFVARGIPVLAYGAHVRADLLRAAREAGAVAVPNSQVETALRELLA